MPSLPSMRCGEFVAVKVTSHSRQKKLAILCLDCVSLISNEIETGREVKKDFTK